jgi:hypothetical protein
MLASSQDMDSEFGMPSYLQGLCVKTKISGGMNQADISLFAGAGYFKDCLMIYPVSQVDLS